MNTALVLSGGVGTRMDTAIPKQYLRVKDKMLITYALEVLLSSAVIDGIWIVADEAWRAAIEEDVRKRDESGLVDRKLMGFGAPGASRQESIWNGLQQIRGGRGRWEKSDTDEKDTVLIHDAARPCLSGELVEACFAALPGHDGVMPVLPMKDTVYFSQKGSRVERLLDRTAIYAGQSPELFLLEKYYHANEALLPDAIREIRGSTEAAIKAGMDVAMIPGEERNFKITTPEDLNRFELLIQESSAVKADRD